VTGGLALLGLWPLLRACGLSSWPQLGIVSLKPHRRELARGLFIGFASLLALWALSLLLGARVLAIGTGNIWGVLGAAAAAAIIVGILEELLFRGALFGLLRQSLDWRLALALSSVIYALAHFLRGTDLPGPVTWKSGLELFPLMFRNLADFHLLIPTFLNLTLVGSAFALAFQRTGALYGSIGLHAAWIFWLKAFLTISQPATGASVAWWGGNNLLNGWLALPFLAGACLLVLRWTPAKSYG